MTKHPEARLPPDLTTLRILFVTAASNAIGFGHLARCLALAAYAHKRHADVGFLVFGTGEAAERVRSAGYSCIRLGEPDMNAAEWPETDRLQADVVIVDLLFPSFASDCHDPEDLFRRLRHLGPCLVALDVLGDFTIAGQSSGIDADIVVIPYVVPPQAGEAPWRVLEGAAYALLASEYADLPPRRQRRPGRRVLVSCGGSDTKGHTAEVLRSLEGVGRRLEVRVVIGPLFSAALRSEVATLAAASRHKVRLTDAPRTLVDEMLWCDLAICASGLTKYELAASSTPALLFSIDAFHDSVHRTFADMGTAVDLGVGVHSTAVAHETERLLDDAALRDKLAAAGRQLVDGRGTERLFTEIKKDLSC